MKAISPKDIIKPALSLIIIAAVTTGILAVANSITEPVIEANNAETAAESMQEVLPDAVSFSDTYENDEYNVEYAEGYDESGALIGYAVTCYGSGYGGTITVMCGISVDNIVTGVAILDIDETPGLGMNAKDEDWLAQFIGKSGTLSVTKSDTVGDSEIQALTSATITSKAMVSAVNSALSFVESLGGGTDG